MVDVSKSCIGVWDGPMRQGKDFRGNDTRALPGAPLMIIGENADTLFVQFDSKRLPQHLRCLPADICRDPDIDWDQAD